VEGFGLAHTAPTPGEDETLVIPMGVLEAVEGSTPDPVELEVGRKLRGAAKWTENGAPRTVPFQALLTGPQNVIPDPPSELAPVPAQFLTALHECGRTAAKESGRFALAKIQLQGKIGRIIGTDGSVALLWSGFRFPFTNDVLIPAVPVFGSKLLIRAGEARIGHSEVHLVITAGSWSVWLPTDTKSRFPYGGNCTATRSHNRRHRQKGRRPTARRLAALARRRGRASARDDRRR
jgi:hypothetical protein